MFNIFHTITSAMAVHVSLENICAYGQTVSKIALNICLLINALHLVSTFTCNFPIICLQFGLSFYWRK